MKPLYKPMLQAWELSEEATRRVEMLAGPHYKTILKVWEVQKEADGASIDL